MIDFYFWPTPNAYKVAIMLAETGLAYKVVPVDILNGDQHDARFRAISPAGKVPAIVDHEGPGGTALPMFESGAILWYLAEKTGKLLRSDPIRRLEMIQWLMFQMGNVGPMLGQAHHFREYAPEKIPYAIERYTREAAKIYAVLDRRLEKEPFLAGTFSIADIAVFTWVRTRKLHGINLDDYPNVKRWYTQIKVRPSVGEALSLLKDDMSWKAGKDSQNWTNLFGSNL